MKQVSMLLSLGFALSVSAQSVNANIIIFDGNFGGTAKVGTVETATGDNTGNPDVYGPLLTFDDFTVSGGMSSGDNLNSGSFDRSDITAAFADQDLSPSHGGLGVCSVESSCAGSTDSFHSNLGGDANSDEVLFFDFASAVTLNTVWFNGDHSEAVDAGQSDADDARFNIYHSIDGVTYSHVFGDQMSPTDSEYLSTGTSEMYGYWAVAASGHGEHGSYVEAISFTEVLEPSSLGLLGLGVIGLYVSRKKKRI